MTPSQIPSSMSPNEKHPPSRNTRITTTGTRYHFLMDTPPKKLRTNNLQEQLQIRKKTLAVENLKFIL